MILFKKKSGFTLIELMVSVSIFTLLTALFLFRADKFDGGILLTNLAYDIALTIREAQVYGLNVLESDGRGFTNAYGVHFETGTNNTKFLLFYDEDNNGIYGGTSELVKKYTMKRGNRINSLCYGASAVLCNQTPTSLDILFKRPSPAAHFPSLPPSTPSYSPSNNYAKIVLIGRDGSTRNIVVQKTGQISVE